MKLLKQCRRIGVVIGIGATLIAPAYALEAAAGGPVIGARDAVSACLAGELGNCGGKDQVKSCTFIYKQDGPHECVCDCKDGTSSTKKVSRKKLESTAVGVEGFALGEDLLIFGTTE